MGKMYILTEKNYKEVLERLQRLCKKWKFLEHYECFEVERRTKKENYPDSCKIYDHKTYGLKPKICNRVEIGEKTYYELSPTVYYKIIFPTEHSFKIAHDNDPKSYEGKQWEFIKPLIHIDCGPASVLVLTYGDKVKFEKYGFIVYTDNDYTRLNESPLNVYKNTFIIARHYRDGAIIDYEAEKIKRDKEWEEEEAWWNKQYEKEMEHGLIYEE